jgi:hypothetical protein
MALTNAEKQKRWRDRRRALAKQAQEPKARVAKVTSRNGGSDNQKIQHAYEATEYARADWVTHLLGLVEAYAEARKKFASDKDFAHWLVENEVGHFAIWSGRKSCSPNSRAYRHPVFGQRWKHAGWLRRANRRGDRRVLQDGHAACFLCATRREADRQENLAVLCPPRLTLAASLRAPNGDQS